jgi:hypothetical protein
MQGYNDEARSMAIAMIYDTLKLAEQLEHEAGFDAARARAMARILAENAGGNLVTREDLLVAKRELECAIQDARSDLQATIGALDGKTGAATAALDEKIGALQSEVRVLYWISGTTLAGMAALLGTAITIALHLMRLG